MTLSIFTILNFPFLKKIYLFIGCFVTAQAFSSCEWRLRYTGFSSWGPPVREQGLSGLQASVVGTHGLSCSEARGIFPDQGSNRFPLHCKMNSQQLDDQEAPNFPILSNSGQGSIKLTKLHSI